jgi:hypothetical protein
LTGIVERQPIDEICDDMREATGSDALFVRVFLPHRRERIGGIDRKLREIAHACIRQQYAELTEGGGGQRGLCTKDAIRCLAQRHRISRQWIYHVIFHET